jgi:RNA polymerase sigma factor (sigma-70 family)
MAINSYVACVMQAADGQTEDRLRQQAFAELVNRFQGMVYGCAVGILNDSMLAEDAVQETFISAWQNLAKLRQPEAFPAWLRRIVVWQCCYYKRNQRPPSVSMETLEKELQDKHNLKEAIAQNDLNRWIRHLIEALPRNKREILILHYLNEYSHVEIAQFLNVSSGTVRKRLHDARKILKAPLAKLLEDTVRRHTLPRYKRFGDHKMSDTKDPITQTDYPQRTPEEIIASIIKPTWCEQTAQGRITWDIFCAAIRNDVDTLKTHLAEDPERAWLEFWYTPPIHFAVREGHLEATHILWEVYPHNEVTKLIHLADDRGHAAVASYLRQQIGAGAMDSDLRLHEAVESGDAEEVDRLLAAAPSLTRQQAPAGRTALHLAVIHNQRDLTGRLLTAKTPINTTDHQGFRPIHYAYWKNTYWHRNENENDLVRLLLDHGAADSITLAAARGDIDTVRAFLQQNPSLANDGDTLQKRPLSAAVEAGHRDIVVLLLEYNANPNQSETRTCPHGSALMTATVNGDLELAKLLLKAGGDPNGHIDSSGTPASRAESDAMRTLLYSYGGKPATIWGYIQKGQIETVAAILNYIDDPFAQDTAEYQTTPYTAIISGYQRRKEKNESTDAHAGMLRLFLQRNYPMPTALTACRGYLWHVPFMTRQLLENGLDPNLPDWQRRTPLHDFAAVANPDDSRFELIKMFLEFGADINAIDEEDRSTALGLAARSGEKRTVQYLLDHGADPNLAGAAWATPLAWAQKRGHEEAATILRQHGAII